MGLQRYAQRAGRRAAALTLTEDPVEARNASERPQLLKSLARAPGLLARVGVDSGRVGVDPLTSAGRVQLDFEILAGGGHADGLRRPTGRRHEPPEPVQERPEASHHRTLRGASTRSNASLGLPA